MRRISYWFLSTLTVVVLMFGYHTSTSGVPSTANPPAVSAGTTGGTTTGSATSGTSSSKKSSSTQTSKGTKTSGQPSAQPSTQPSTVASTVTGTVAQTEWGPVQVQLTVTSGKVTHVSVVQYPHGNSRDQEINGYALPVLIKETLDQQTAQIDMVSGATVTSTGYLQSLQSALDQAHL